VEGLTLLSWLQRRATAVALGGAEIWESLGESFYLWLIHGMKVGPCLQMFVGQHSCAEALYCLLDGTRDVVCYKQSPFGWA
jgi:hypothetical protein